MSDFEEKLARAQALGIKVLQQATLRTESGFQASVVFLDTEALCGTTLELIRVKNGPFTVPSSRLLMEIGVLLGDGSKINLEL